MRYFIKIALWAAVAVTFIGCFKDEKQGTAMRIAVYSQNVEDDPIMKATDLEAYAFWVEKNDNWEVTSWEDALARRITNKDNTSITRSTPDEIGLFDPEAEYQIRLELWSLYTFAVVVDKANRMYAYRKYETPMNLAEVLTQLHLYAWRKSGSANGWTTVNPFPDEKREPLVPKDDPNEESNEESQN